MEEINSQFEKANLNETFQQPVQIAGGRRKKPARAHHTFEQPAVQSNFASNNLVEQPQSQFLGNGGILTGFDDGTQINNGQAPVADSSSLSQEQNLQQQSSGADLAEQRINDQKFYNNTTFDTSRNAILPMKTTAFYSADTGVCDPRIMSLTMYNIPESESLRNCTKLPIGLNLQPFAPTLQLNSDEALKKQEKQLLPSSADEFDIDAIKENEEFEEEFEEGKFQVHYNKINNEIGIIRCPRCRAYNNHNFQFSADNQFLTCNLCKTNSKNPLTNTMSINSLMNMSNVNISPINGGVLDFEAPKEYNHISGEESKPLHYVFMIDITSFANMNGSSVSIIEAVQNSVELIAAKQPNCKVAIMGYDRNLHFFKLSPDLEKAKEYIVGDLYGDTREKGNENGSVFIPFYKGLFVKPGDCMHIINNALSQLKDHAINNKYMHLGDLCFGPAVEACMKMLKENANGGKILASMNALPVYARGSLQLRKDDTFQKDMKFGDHDYYRTIGNRLLKEACSIDLFITTAAFVDVCNIGFLALNTGGKIHYYPHFQQAKDDFKVVSDYLSSISSIVGYQCALKLRTGSGLRVESYYNQTAMFEKADPQFPVITTKSNVSILLKNDGNIKEKDVHIQAALLYTDINGKRMIRVINNAAAVTNSVSEVYKFVDQENIADIIVKGSCVSLRYQATEYQVIRDNINNKLSEILTQYKTTTNNHKLSSSLVVIPESLKHLPIYLLAFQKSLLMTQTKQSTRGNERVMTYFEFLTLPLNEVVLKLYPQIIPIHADMVETDLTFHDPYNNLLTFESSKALSVKNSLKSLVNGGLYLVYNGNEVWISFNQNTNILLLKDLLDYDFTPANPLILPSGIFPATEAEINMKCRNLIKFWSNKTFKYNNFVKVNVLYPHQQSNNSLIMSLEEYNNILRYQIMFDDQSFDNVESLDQFLGKMNMMVSKKIDRKDYLSVGSSQTKSEEATFAQKYMHF
ncbi:hypothetical protein QEN19_000880 [Hanseniaspora menglaensis]